MWILLIFFLIIVFIFLRKRYDTEEDDEDTVYDDTQVVFGEIDYLDCDGYWQMNTGTCEDLYSGICLAANDTIHSQLYNEFVVQVLPVNGKDCLNVAKLAAPQYGIDPDKVNYVGDDILNQYQDCGFPQCTSCDLGYCIPSVASTGGLEDSNVWDPTDQYNRDTLEGYCLTGRIQCSQCLYVDADGSPTGNPTDPITKACDAPVTESTLSDCVTYSGQKYTIFDRLSPGSFACSYKIIDDVSRVKCTPGFFYSFDTPENRDGPRTPWSGLTWNQIDWFYYTEDGVDGYQTGYHGIGPGIYYKTFYFTGLDAKDAKPVWMKLFGDELHNYINKYVQIQAYPGYVFTYNDTYNQEYVNWIGDITTGNVTFIVKPTRFFNTDKNCIKGIDDTGNIYGGCDGDNNSELSNSYIAELDGPLYADNKDLWPNMLLQLDYTDDAPDRLITCPAGSVPVYKSEVLSHQPAYLRPLLDVYGGTCAAADFCYTITGNGINRNGTDRDYDWNSIFSVGHNDPSYGTHSTSNALVCMGVNENPSDFTAYSLYTDTPSGTVCPSGYITTGNVCTLDTSTLLVENDSGTYDIETGIWMYALKYP